LANNKVGALIAIEREVGLGGYIERGVPIDGEVRSELLATIFYPGTDLHDGAAVIRQGRIAAAGCLFPLSDNPNLGKNIGTRHRAGVGVTEETDCVSVIVSEESGVVSLSVRGQLYRGLDPKELERMLYELYAQLDLVRGGLPSAEAAREAGKQEGAAVRP
ncbi:MAG: DNA integrity scanning protein DisA nucleotide-binding domain protein, partial [Planctomycetes bacterium]|nr:DNA integrity scanning protein DisA nucleotide-binding domain protein [Planctomycetota bacterium]